MVESLSHCRNEKGCLDMANCEFETLQKDQIFHHSCTVQQVTRPQSLFHWGLVASTRDVKRAEPYFTTRPFGRNKIWQLGNQVE